MKENNEDNKNFVSENESHNNIACINEKRIIICLIIITVLLIYYSLFFIHDINYRGSIEDKKSVEIEYSSNNNKHNNTIDSNSSQGNNVIINNSINGNMDNNVVISNSVNGNMGNNVIINNGISNNSSNNSTNNSSNNNPEKEEINDPLGNIVTNKDRFKIMQGTEEWKDLKSLDIFKNNYFNNNSIIAPGVHGEYSFTVENYRENKVKYNINFLEENIYNINMVYKLKLNGTYIAGNEQEFVKCEELNKEDLVIDINTNDIFTIEWKWQGGKNDTQIGKTEGANYRLKIKVNVSEL